MTTDISTELAPQESWALLRQSEFGRLAFHLLGEVHIVPVNYATAGERILFRTAEGSKLLGITLNRDVAFEIDNVDEHLASSVVARGTARELPEHDAELADLLPLRPWIDTEKSHVVAIDVSEITGRRFHLSKPWTHLTIDED